MTTFAVPFSPASQFLGRPRPMNGATALIVEIEDFLPR
jgi:hypothetical protein